MHPRRLPPRSHWRKRRRVFDNPATAIPVRTRGSDDEVPRSTCQQPLQGRDEGYLPARAEQSHHFDESSSGFKALTASKTKLYYLFIVRSWRPRSAHKPASLQHGDLGCIQLTETSSLTSSDHLSEDYSLESEENQIIATAWWSEPAFESVLPAKTRHRVWLARPKKRKSYQELRAVKGSQGGQKLGSLGPGSPKTWAE